MQALARFPARGFGGFHPGPYPAPETFEGVFELKRSDGNIQAMFVESTSHPMAKPGVTWGTLYLEDVVAVRSAPWTPWHDADPGWQEEVTS